MRSLWLLLRRSSGLAWFGAAASLFAGIVTALVVIGTQRLFSRPDNPPSVGWLLLGLLAMLVTNLIAQALIQKLAGNALRDLQVDLAARLIAAPLRRLETVGASRLMAVQLNDSQAISGGIFVIPLMISNLVVLFVCFGYLATRSGILVGVLFSVLVVMLAMVVLIGRSARRLDRRARAQADELIAHVRYATEGAKELKMSFVHRESFLKEGLFVAAAKQERAFFAASTLHVLSSNVGRLLIFLAIIVIAVAGSWAALPHAELSSFGFVILFASGPLAVVLANAPSLVRALVALETIRELGFELSSEPPALTSHPPVSSLPVSLTSVSHAYAREDGTAFVLGPLDFQVHPGEVVFVVGGNGSGKSTLVKLLTGLYSPESGEIRLGDTLITSDLVPWYREHFSAVFYDYALPIAIELTNDPELERLLASMDLGHLASRGPRLDPAELSSGQRRRLALIFALRQSRPIYVFDEWASDQDPTFKQRFYRTILPELRARGIGVVVVSHDDRYYDCADRIVRLENGQLESVAAPAPAPSAVLVSRSAS